MKKLIVLVLSFMSLQSIAQNINEYEFVIVPLKFDFQSEENEYRLNTLLKFRLEEFGFKPLYASGTTNVRFDDRCKFLNVNVVKESNLLVTKLKVVFTDCNNAVIYESNVGKSKEKLRKIGYKEALEEALKSVKELNYNYIGVKDENESVKVEASVPLDTVIEEDAKTTFADLLFAQPIPNGFQLVDSTPKVVLKIYKASESNHFIASSDSKNGILYKKNDYWIFEYYVNGKLMSEKLNIKF